MQLRNMDVTEDARVASAAGRHPIPVDNRGIFPMLSLVGSSGGTMNGGMGVGTTNRVFLEPRCSDDCRCQPLDL